MAFPVRWAEVAFSVLSAVDQRLDVIQIPILVDLDGLPAEVAAVVPVDNAGPYARRGAGVISLTDPFINGSHQQRPWGELLRRMLVGFQVERSTTMSDPNTPADEPMPAPTWKPSPPEMELEPIPLPDRSGEGSLAGTEQPPLDQGRVTPVSTPDEANIDTDDALPEDGEEEVLGDDPSREDTRFDEEVPKSSV